MANHLKLVSSNQPVTRARPIRTEYSSPGFGGVGHSRTIKGALKAAVARVTNGEFSGAKIFDELDFVAYRVTRRANVTTIRRVEI